MKKSEAHVRSSMMVKKVESIAMGFRQSYELHGIENYYKQNANTYSNPHKEAIQFLVRTYCNRYTSILDLACGSGEVTEAMMTALNCHTVLGIDPYTADLYRRKTNYPALHMGFKELVGSGLPEHFDATICSYAMHLVPESLMHQLCWRIASFSEEFVVISPTKHPKIPEKIWRLKKSTIHERTHLRIYDKA